MKTTVNEINAYTREIDVHIPWDELKDDYDKSLRAFSNKIKLPGFRKGKVPSHVILKNYKEVVDAEFIEDSFQKYYLKALTEEKIQPVNRADVKDLDFKDGEFLTFKAEFEIEPDVTLPTLKKNSLRVEKTKYISDEVDVDMAIEEIQRTYAEVQTVEDGAAEGDFILADLQKMDAEGVPVIGDKIEKRYLKLGDGIFVDDNLKKLTGLKPGDTAKLDFSEESGEITQYEVSVINVERQVLPEVDLELAKKVDPKTESLKAWKEKIKEQIDNNYEKQAKEAYERKLSDAMIDRVNPDAPPSMVDFYLERLVEDVKKQNNGEKIDEEEVKKTYRDISERNLKWYLVRKAIIQEQNIEISKDEINEKITELKDRSPDYAKEIDKYYKKPSHRQRLEDDLTENKLLDYLQSFAKVKLVKVKTKTVRNTAEIISK